jgi:hypothetical protein
VAGLVGNALTVTGLAYGEVMSAGGATPLVAVALGVVADDAQANIRQLISGEDVRSMRGDLIHDVAVSAGASEGTANTIAAYGEVATDMAAGMAAARQVMATADNVAGDAASIRRVGGESVEARQIDSVDANTAPTESLGRDGVDFADVPDSPTEAYNRRAHYGSTPTAADRAAVGAGTGQVADHEPPLVQRYYEGDPAKGEKPGYLMTPEERRASAGDRSRMAPQSATDSNAQGAEMSRYSREKKKEHDL